MRIIAGRLRHRVLLSNPGVITRPITDRVKESLFSRLGDSVEGKRVLDIFAGTGTLGLEALSRGAESVVFIEKDPTACDLLRKNLAAFKVQDQTLCWQTDALRASYRPKGAALEAPFDLIFFDPPYRLVPEMTPGSPLFKALERLAKPEVSREAARLIFRVPEKSVLQMPSAWVSRWNFVMSNMDVQVFQRASQPAVDMGTIPHDNAPLTD